MLNKLRAVKIFAGSISFPMPVYTINDVTAANVGKLSANAEKSTISDLQLKLLPEYNPTLIRRLDKRKLSYAEEFLDSDVRDALQVGLFEDKVLENSETPKYFL